MATLVYSDADGADGSFVLGSEPVVVGRAAECQILSRDPRVSKMHARFYVDQGMLWVEDLGSTNGVFVGQHKVQRAQVPTGEMILIGSLVVRLLPASGTLPPPIGLHGTLAAWLEIERKSRAAIADERNALAIRVRELHDQLAEAESSSNTMTDGTTPHDREVDPVAVRDELEAKLAALANALAASQNENQELRTAAASTSDSLRSRDELAHARVGFAALELDLATAKGARDEAQSARSVAEHAAGEAMRDAQALRHELDQVRRAAGVELESLRDELAKTRDAKMMAETAAGVAVAEKLVDADRVREALERDLATAKQATASSTAASDVRVRELTELNAAATGRIEKAEKDLAAAQIRAQGAERNLAGASASAAKAEARTAQLEQTLADATARANAAADDLAKAREQIAALELRAAASEEPLHAAEARAAKLVADLAAITSQFESQRGRLAELETAVAAAREQATDGDARAVAARAELATATATLAEADRRATELQARVDQLATAEAEIAAAAQAKQDATDRAAAAETRAAEANRRAETAEQRASAADTMAKAMAKDVAEALRRAAEADMRARSAARELENAQQRADTADALGATVADAQRRFDEARADAERERQEFETKLATERSSSLALIERKTQLEREVAEAAQATARAEAAELALRERSAQIQTLQDRVLELEHGIGASETAQQTSLTEARTEIDALKLKLAEATATADTIASQRKVRIDELEARLGEAERARDAAEHALRGAHGQIGELANADTSDRARLEQALSERAAEADLAIGRAAALQRQLDEAISKLAAMEIEVQRANRSEQSGAEQFAAAETRASAAEARIADAERRAQELEHSQDTARAASVELEQRFREAEAQIADAERRARELERTHDTDRAASVELEQRFRDAETALGVARQRAETAELALASVQRQLVERDDHVATLEREVATAENVRSFAAETEREIAQLQHALGEARGALAQRTLERDQLANDLRDARGDTDTTSRRAAPPVHDTEVTASHDVGRMESILARSAELEHKVADAEREIATLRAQHHGAGSPQTGSRIPPAFAEHVTVLEESIDSLRANMRAASDETAVMAQSDSVIAVASAVSQAAEHIERARAAVRVLASSMG